MEKKCEGCGGKVRVEGSTTKHYVAEHRCWDNCPVCGCVPDSQVMEGEG